MGVENFNIEIYMGVGKNVEILDGVLVCVLVEVFLRIRVDGNLILVKRLVRRDMMRCKGI